MFTGENKNALTTSFTLYIFIYSWLGMLIRSALAAIDFNSNIQRKTKMSDDGKPLYKMKVKFVLE